MRQMGFWNIVNRVIEEADIVLHIIDARMPEFSKNQGLENMTERMHRKLVYVFNKSDLISDDVLKDLRKGNKGAFFVSGAKNLGMKKLKIGLLIMAKKMGIENPKIGIVGYPNVGKSSVINALAKSAKAAVSPTAGTTRGFQYIKAGSLRIIDSPGVIPREKDETKLGMIAARNPEDLRNPEKVACEIIDKIRKINKKALEEYYGFEIDNDMDAYELLLRIGQEKKMLLK
ncbi:MAG: 50S ribosome-binding GTPase, partial [archaeon]|nr:50S ribosome-binding GTPase [archaeon]